eukprot:scaffold1415_cov117-Isochrysis_galbana.AAC.12
MAAPEWFHKCLLMFASGRIPTSLVVDGSEGLKTSVICCIGIDRNSGGKQKLSRMLSNAARMRPAGSCVVARGRSSSSSNEEE